jgi:hypothetical protein
MIKQNPWVGNTHFLHGFWLSTHQIIMIYKWDAQNILTRSISYDILGVAIHICNMVIALQPKTMLKTGPANLLLG